MIDVVLAFLILHRIDGFEVRVAPSQITSLHSPRRNLDDPDDKIYDKRANCLVGLTDGKSVQVVETCTDIVSRMEKAQ